MSFSLYAATIPSHLQILGGALDALLNDTAKLKAVWLQTQRPLTQT